MCLTLRFRKNKQKNLQVSVISAMENKALAAAIAFVAKFKLRSCFHSGELKIRYAIATI